MHFGIFGTLLLYVAVSIPTTLLVDANRATFSAGRRSASEQSAHDAPHRKMVAARSAASLGPRDPSSTRFLKYEHVLPFMDGGSVSAEHRAAMPASRSTFAAHVQLKSTLPTMLIEEHEGLLESIRCHDSTIELRFYDVPGLSAASLEIGQHPQLQVITSHAGCNTDGERHPYLVTHVRRGERSLVLSIKPSSFKQSFQTIDIRFGSQGNVPLIRHDQLRKRQETSATSAPTTGPPISFPPAPTTTPSATRIAGATITTTYAGETIIPPSFPGSNLLIPDLPLGLTVKCKECSLQGSIDLTNGVVGATQQPTPDEEEGFFDALSGNVDEIVTFYQDGYFELTVNDFSAHIELESTVIPSVELAHWTTYFPDIGIPGWIIPQIATIGPILRPTLTFGVQLATSLTFTYGFDLTIPNNSTLHLDISDPAANSTINNGFLDTKFSALPFQSKVDNINLTVSAAFSPQLLLAVKVFDDTASLAAGALLDLPKLSATVAQVSGVDDHCNPLNASASSEKEGKDGEGVMLTNIVPRVDFDVGVLVEAKLDVMANPVDVGATATVTGAGYQLPTACISYDGRAKTYKAAASEGATGESSAMGGFGRPAPSVVALLMVVWAVNVL